MCRRYKIFIKHINTKHPKSCKDDIDSIFRSDLLFINLLINSHTLILLYCFSKSLCLFYLPFKNILNMKIGLVRHFKVVRSNTLKNLNSAQFNELMENYDHFPVKANEIIINSNDWEICYTSTLSRAYETAKTIYQGEIITTDLIIEVPLSAFMKTDIKLPSMFWHVGGRIAWLFSSETQKENISGTKHRIDNFLKIIYESGHKNILVVSHGFFMKVFARQLNKLGFVGSIDFAPKNGKLYLFEK